MASILNATTTSGLVTSADNSGSLQLQTNNGTTAVTIDTNQRLLVGTTTGGRNFVLGGGAGNSIMSFNNDSTGYTIGDGFQIQLSGTNTSIWTYENDYIRFGTNDTERMRITSGGSLLVNTTNSNSDGFKFKVQAATNVCVGVASATSIAGALTFNLINDANSANVPVDFRCNGFYISNGLATGAGTNTVKFDTGTKQLTYDTSSARYKKNIRDSIYGLDHVMQMRSAQFEYKDSGRSDVGLIAEELNPIIPELVAKNEEGLPDAVSYDRMVSVLVKAIQEQQAMIEELKQEVQLLKNPPVEGVA